MVAIVLLSGRHFLSLVAVSALPKLCILYLGEDMTQSRDQEVQAILHVPGAALQESIIPPHTSV